MKLTIDLVKTASLTRIQNRLTNHTMIFSATGGRRGRAETCRQLRIQPQKLSCHQLPTVCLEKLTLTGTCERGGFWDCIRRSLTSFLKS